MSFINTSNAIPAKARAKYGRRLKEKDYRLLINCKSVAEVIAYLKNNTHYAPMLAKVNEFETHRGQLETLLRRQLFYDFDSLCRYEMSVGSNFSRFIIRKYEIIQIVRFLTLLNSGRTQEYIFVMPDYFNKHTELHLDELLHAVSYDDFLHALRNSPYEELLAQFKPADGEGVDISAVEDRLQHFLYNGLFSSIDKLSSKSEKEELTELFESIVNFTNAITIYRLRHYYDLSADEVKARLLPHGTLKTKEIEKLCAAESAKEFIDEFAATPSGKAIKKMHYNYNGEISSRAKFNISRKNMYFSENPTVVLFSYIFATETELTNIINIVEGVRYGLTPSEIDKLLIYR